MTDIASSFMNSSRITDRDLNTLKQNIENIQSEDYSARTIVKEVVTYQKGSFVRDKQELRKFDERIFLGFLSQKNIFQESEIISKTLSRFESNVIGTEGGKNSVKHFFEELQQATLNFLNAPHDNHREIFWQSLEDFLGKLNDIDNYLSSEVNNLDDLINNSVKNFNNEISSIYQNNKNYLRDFYSPNGRSNDYADMIDKSFTNLQNITNLNIVTLHETRKIEVSIDENLVLNNSKKSKLYYEDGKLFINKNNDLTENITKNKGELGAFLKLKNQIIPSFKQHFDEFKNDLIGRINSLGNTAYYKKSEIQYGEYFDTIDNSLGVKYTEGSTLRISLVNASDDNIFQEIDIDLSELFINPFNNSPKSLAELERISVKDFIEKINTIANESLFPSVANFNNNRINFSAPLIEDFQSNIFISGDLKINGQSINEFFHVNNLINFNTEKQGYEIQNSVKSNFIFQEVQTFSKTTKTNFTSKNTEILNKINNILTNHEIEFDEIKTEEPNLIIKAHKTTFQKFLDKIVLTETEIISNYATKTKRDEEKFNINKSSYLDSKQVDITMQQKKFEEVMQLKEYINKIYKMSKEVLKSLMEVL